MGVSTLQSMLAMWRLILGHGKPRMFAALAAQRAALAAAPRSPAKQGLQLQQPARCALIASRWLWSKARIWGHLRAGVL